MSSHNIDENSLLKYISASLSAWGINYINKDILKKARDNKKQAHSFMFRLVFDLSILHLIDYQYTSFQLGIRIDENDHIMQDIVLAYLQQSRCPYWKRGNGDEGNNVQKIDLKNSRSLLLIVGWMMAVSEFFSKIKSKLIDKIYKQLYIDKIIGSNQLHTPLTAGNAKIQSHSDQKQILSQLEQKYKKLSGINYRIECMHLKKQWLIKKLQQKMSRYYKDNKNQQQLSLNNLLVKGSPIQQSEQFLAKEEQLMQIIKQQSNGMKNQQYFWMWLQIRVAEPYYKQLCQQSDGYIDESSTEKNPSKIKMSSEYLSRYINAYNNSYENLNEINEMMNQLLPLLEGDKKRSKQLSKMVQKQVKGEIEQILAQENPIDEVEIPSFISIELKKYLQQKGFLFSKDTKKKQRKNNTQNQKQSEKKRIQTKRNQTLKIEIKQFVSNLEALKFM